MRNFTGETEFAGAAKAIARVGAGEFMISPGDIDPPDAAYDVIRSSVGAAYPWYPVAGNHEAETPSDMDWLRAFNAGGELTAAHCESGTRRIHGDLVQLRLRECPLCDHQ